MSTDKPQTDRPTASLLLSLLLVGAILLPFGYGLDLGPGPNRIRALAWEYMDAPWFSGIRLVRIGQVFEGILYTLPTYIFLYQIFISYRTGAKQKYLVPAGLLGGLFPGLFSLIQIIGWVFGWTQPPPSVSDHHFPIYIPLPTVFILYLVLARLLPRRTTDPESN